MLDIRKLKELVRLMVANDLTELDLRDSEEQVTLRRHNLNHAPQVLHHAAQPVMAAPPPVAVTSGPDAAPPAEAESEAEGLVRIESPMVGTCYSAPSPDAAPFVKAGDRVDTETVVCLVEAMKIFNEIKAECGGVIEKALVNSGDAVEFGQPLFLVRPA